MDISEFRGIILGNLEFFAGLIAGLVGSLYSLYQRKIELKSKLYYPLFISCYNLLLIFQEIKTIKNDEKHSIELYKVALKNLDDIMNSYGTITNLKSNDIRFPWLKSKVPEKDYLTTFFKVKRFIDLNLNSIQDNWDKATILFEKGKENKQDDPELNSEISEFHDLYNGLLELKELCEEKDKTLKGVQKL